MTEAWLDAAQDDLSAAIQLLLRPGTWVCSLPGNHRAMSRKQCKQ